MKNLIAGALLAGAVLFNLCHAAETTPTSRTTVVMLGTGTPNFEADRAGQAILVVVDKKMFLFDAGPGFVRNFNALSGTDFMAPDIYFSNQSMYGEMNKLFLTHLDSDHVLGVPEFLLRPWVLGRDQPITVVGPKGTQNLINESLNAFKDDLDHRLHGTQPSNPDGYKAKVTEIDHGQIVYQDSQVKITAFEVFHGSWSAGMAYGYRVETPTKTIVLSGDTRDEKSLDKYFEGADILIHEVMSEKGVSKLNSHWQKYMYHAHTSTRQLAALANRVKPKKLVLNHPLFYGTTPAALTKEVTDHYDGKVVLAKDLDIYQ